MAKTYSGNTDDLKKAGLPYHTCFARTEEYRAVKPGEWYLSGAKPRAWLAKNGTNTEFRILRPVPLPYNAY